MVDVRAKAEKGDAQSQYELGRIFARGNLGVVKDAVEAVKWYRRAAEQHHPVAQFSRGVSNDNGHPCNRRS